MKKFYFHISILFLVAQTLTAQTGTWSIQVSPVSVNLNSVSYSNANIWVAVGDGGTIIRSSNGGINWVNVTSPVTDNLEGVCLHGQNGIAVGISGRVARSTDAGATWFSVTRPTTRNLYSVSMSDFMSVAVGAEGFIYVSYDNGQTWSIHTAGTAATLLCSSVNGSTAVGAGGMGAVVMSVNGGSGWGLTVISTQTTAFYGASFVNSNTGWIVGMTTSGNVIARSNNGGFSWSGETAPVSDGLFGVSFPSMDTGTAVGINGSIIHTDNGGSTWTVQTSGVSQILHGVSFSSTTLGIAVGDAGTILRTTGGLTGISQTNNSVPGSFNLKQNYPNPFNPSTKIDFSLPKAGNVKITVTNSVGAVVSVPVNGSLNAGNYSVTWNASELASGVYFCRLEAEVFSQTRKMILVK